MEEQDAGRALNPSANRVVPMGAQPDLHQSDYFNIQGASLHQRREDSTISTACNFPRGLFFCLWPM